MSDSSPEDGDDSEDSSSRSMWLKAAAAAGLGFELVGFALAGIFVGVQVDAYFGTSPLGLLVMLVAAFIGAGWHISRVTRRFLLDDDE